MRGQVKNPRLLLATALILASPVTAHGDDIELFVSTNTQPIQCEAPNVLFLIDTSGSMITNVRTQLDWDPGQRYVGCYSADDYYYGSAGVPPDCDSTAAFAKSANACAAFANTEYTGEFQAWDPSGERWVKLADAQGNWVVECAADEGIHGDGTNSANYAVDGPAGPWSEQPDNRIAWGANASSVTVYDGNWLNWLANPPTTDRSRLEIVQEVTRTALDNMDNVNVALMAFNEQDGGSVLRAVEALDTARAPMKQAIDALIPSGGTPLSESLYELGQYLRGGSVDFGTAPLGESVAESRVGGSLTSDRYLSPLNFAGQNTYIVLLTDGEPAGDSAANRLIEALPGYGQLVGDACDDNVEGSCLDSMAEYLFRADLRPDIPGTQNVITHTIGFNVDLPILASTAQRGGGKYFTADNTASLTSVLSNLTKDFARTASLLAAPQIPINSFNSAERLNDVYVSVFQPAATQHWPGNVKRYRLQETGAGITLVDAYGNEAINPDTGLFNDNAVSFWSAPLADGGTVTLGGAASQLPPPATRRLYTNVGSGGGLQELTVANPNITAALIGAPDDQRDTTIEWARGLDSRDMDEDGIVLEPRQSMGDPLHVQPVTVSYGTDPDNANALVFVATNDGYLHALDAASGAEAWSFIPRRLLGRLYELSLQEPAVNKEYGLDGEIRVVEAGGRKILVFGMRRGGEAMYALDVTLRDAPRLRWLIDSSQSGFRDLGQTWSPATAARVSVGAGATDVLLFGGGYDAGQDNGGFRTDVKGNAIYMVDTLTGELLWSAGSPAAQSDHDLELPLMRFSIPAALRVLDTDRNGFADRIYAGDMGAQVWRFDIVNGQGRASLGEGGVIASLGAADQDVARRADARRFYNTPDVVEVIEQEKLYTAINIGSGYRAHPLDTSTEEEFYSIRDFRPREIVPTELYGTSSLPIVTRADLVDVTDDQAPRLEPTDAGWRLRMEARGEKILSSSLTVANVLFFTSFMPAASDASCLPSGGQNRLYRVSVLGGFALTNVDQSLDEEVLTKEDRYVNVGGMLSVPLELVAGPEGKPCVGLDCSGGTEPGDDSQGGVPDGPRVYETYWFPVTSSPSP